MSKKVSSDRLQNSMRQTSGKMLLIQENRKVMASQGLADQKGAEVYNKDLHHVSDQMLQEINQDAQIRRGS